MNPAGLAPEAADFRWSAEFRGLVTAALEAGLYDLPGVIPELPRVPAPGQPLQRLVLRPADARLTLSGPPEALILSLSICVAGGACEEIAAPPCRREDPWPAVAALLEGAALALGALPPEETRRQWAVRGSADTYAELLTGRAAAMWYGILPLPDPLPRGNMHPAFRAVLVDPRQPLAQWIWARWQIGADADGGRAREGLSRASVLRPQLAWPADLAWLLELSGRPAEAADVYAALLRASPLDPRFLEARARTLLAAGDPGEALAALQTLPPGFRWEPRVAALQVEITAAAAAAAGRPADLDPLLAHWQQTDSRAAEPVRRRIDNRAQQEDYRDALSLLPPLRDRAPGPATDALEAALLVAVGDLDAARPLLSAATADRLAMRTAQEADPGADPAGADPAGQDDTIRRLAAQAALYRGDAPAALRILGADDGADAWAIRARALERTGQVAQAAAAWQEAWRRDPGMEGGPVEERRIR